MEVIKTRLKTIAWFLTALMLFQSCVVYHKTPTTLEKSSQEKIKTKVTNSDGTVFKYKYITYDDGKFYGVNVKSGEQIKTPLQTSEVTQVLSQNKSGSTWATIAIILIPIIAILVIAGLAMEDAFDWNLPEENSGLYN